MIDAHQHFWQLARGDYGWLTPDLEPLHRDFSPADLAPLLAAAGIARSVLVQAAPTVEETRFLLGLCAEAPFVAGVVGWADLAAPSALEILGDLAAHPQLVGLRPMIQDIPDPDWMLDAALAPALREMAERGLRLDALVLPVHLPRLLTLLERHPDLAVVVDHAAKPAIASGAYDGWARDMARIARETGAFCKLSGLVTEAAPDWKDDDLRRYVDHLLDCFGAERLMWGSDWPVVELAGGYQRWRETTLRLLAGLGPRERQAVLGGSARHFYDLGDGPGAGGDPDGEGAR